MGHRARMKASDVFRETNSVFAEKVSFSEAFPEIKEVMVEVEEHGVGVIRGHSRLIYKKDSIGEFIDCSNLLCYNGGFSIGKILREMVRKKQTTLETSKFCQGYEGSPKGKRRYRSCRNTFEIKVQIEYLQKNEDANGDN